MCRCIAAARAPHSFATAHTCARQRVHGTPVLAVSQAARYAVRCSAYFMQPWLLHCEWLGACNATWPRACNATWPRADCCLSSLTQTKISAIEYVTRQSRGSGCTALYVLLLRCMLYYCCTLRLRRCHEAYAPAQVQQLRRELRVGCGTALARRRTPRRRAAPSPQRKPCGDGRAVPPLPLGHRRAVRLRAAVGCGSGPRAIRAREGVLAAVVVRAGAAELQLAAYGGGAAQTNGAA